jgi:hypothetical protein
VVRLSIERYQVPLEPSIVTYPEFHFPTINYMILPAELGIYRMKLFSAGQEILQGDEVLVHIFQPLGDGHGHTFVELGRH